MYHIVHDYGENIDKQETKFLSSDNATKLPVCLFNAYQVIGEVIML